MQMSSTITVDTLLIVSTLWSSCSSLRFGFVIGTMVRRYKSFAMICDDETTSPSAVLMTALKTPTPINAASQVGKSLIKSSGSD